MKKLLLIAASALAMTAAHAQQSGDLKLVYDYPASDWMMEALPIGNGYMGAMFYGTPKADMIQFNEESLWEGGAGSIAEYNGGNKKEAYKFLEPIRQLLREGKIKEAYALANKELTGAILMPSSGDPSKPEFGDYGAFQNFGSVIVTPSLAGDNYTDYHRELDISRAVGLVSYKIDGVELTNQYFASYPKRLIVARYSNSSPEGLRYQITITTPHKNSTIKQNKHGELVLEGNLDLNKMGFEARIAVKTDGKLAKGNSDKLTIQGAHYVEVYLTAATQYKNIYPTYRGNDPQAQNEKSLAALASNSYDQMLNEHVADYKNLFDRLTLTLPDSKQSKLPIKQRKEEYSNGAYDPQLEALFFQWGRYLLIASSRPGTLPANLQGKWNNSTNPPWASDYHMNINQQMIYWLAPVTALPETTEPFIDYILSLREPGRVTAREYFNARGWSVHTMNNHSGYTAPGWEFNWGYAPNGAAWISRHLWEHYAYYPDKEYLTQVAYPVMKELAQFWFDYLVKDSDGTLVSSPSYSPEHGDIAIGATMDHEVVWDLMTNILDANKVVNDDPLFIDSVKYVLANLSPLKIGRYGQLQEWKEDLDNPTNNHRHLSHMYGLYPSKQISPLTDPKLAEAARRSIQYRGDDGTGWSLAWKIAFWARLLDGNKAYDMSRRVLRPSYGTFAVMEGGGGSYDNLLCAHPPFQLDGNMGYVAGVCEMLLQSQTGDLLLLPALPNVWPTGEIKGIRARGGYAVDMKWEDGKLAKAIITSDKYDSSVNIVYKDDKRTINLKKGEPFVIDYTKNE